MTTEKRAYAVVGDLGFLGTPDELRAAIIEAGFQPGDEVVILPREDAPKGLAATPEGQEVAPIETCERCGRPTWRMIFVHDGLDVDFCVTGSPAGEDAQDRAKCDRLAEQRRAAPTAWQEAPRPDLVDAKRLSDEEISNMLIWVEVDSETGRALHAEKKRRAGQEAPSALPEMVVCDEPSHPRRLHPPWDVSNAIAERCRNPRPAPGASSDEPRAAPLAAPAEPEMLGKEEERGTCVICGEPRPECRRKSLANFRNPRTRTQEER